MNFDRPTITEQPTPQENLEELELRLLAEQTETVAHYEVAFKDFFEQLGDHSEAAVKKGFETLVTEKNLFTGGETKEGQETAQRIKTETLEEVLRLLKQEKRKRNLN